MKGSLSPEGEAAMEFGSRSAFFANLRGLFLCQTSYLLMSIVLAKAVEKKLVGMQ